MRTYRGLDALPDTPPGTVVALGNFDGVHRGHQALLALARERAAALGVEAWVLTFDPHPSHFLAPELAPPLLCSLERRLARLAAHGVDATVVLRFDAELAATEPEAFVDRYLVGCGAREVVAGYDFTFGRARSGDTDALRALGDARGLRTHVVPPVTVQPGIVPSSTKIREYLLEGRVGAAASLLGRPHEVEGRVVRGAGRGAALGFPTANVAIEHGVLPASGVYAVTVALEDGTRYGGAANVGTNPTFTDTDVVGLEVHLLDYDGPSLVQRHLVVAFYERLRPERRFGSVDELVTQITSDVTRSREILAERLEKASE